MKTERGFSKIKYPRSGATFIQPLALALVCLFFVGLLLTMGAMDFRILDRTFRGYFEKQGSDFIQSVQRTAGLNLRQGNNSPKWDLGRAAVTGSEDEDLSLQDAMVMALLQLARHIDREIENGMLTREALVSLVLREGLWNLALFDARGMPTFQKQPVSGRVQEAVWNMIKSREDLKIQMFEPFSKHAFLRFLALRRNDGEGFVVLVLDDKSSFFWHLKMALEMAVDAVGMPSNIDCFWVRNDSGLTLFQWGACPETDTDAGLIGGFVSRRIGVSGEKVVSEGRRQLMMAERISLGGEVSLVAHLWLNADDLHRIIAREKRWGLMAMGLMVFLVVLSMWFLYRNQNRHIARMRQMESRLQQAERLSSMGRLAAGVAHEIRNPLNAIGMACQRLKRDNLEHLSPVIRGEVRRLNAIIEEFLGFSKGHALKLEEADLSELVGNVVFLMGEESRCRGIEIRSMGTESRFMVTMDSNKIRQVLINIVKNAFESMKGPGSVKIQIGSRGKRTAFISITDTGEGVLEDDMDQIFDPDFTTKEKGLGLGLTLAHEIIQAHGGEIRVQSTPDMGTTVLILLPAEVNRK